MKHTTGPWWISETGPRYSVNAGTGGAGLRHVAMVSCHEAFVADTGENIANARLIAAAPDMLEALEAVLGWYNGPTDVEGMIRKAIIKAKRG